MHEYLHLVNSIGLKLGNFEYSLNRLLECILLRKRRLVAKLRILVEESSHTRGDLVQSLEIRIHPQILTQLRELIIVIVCILKCLQLLD